MNNWMNEWKGEGMGEKRWMNECKEMKEGMHERMNGRQLPPSLLFLLIHFRQIIANN